MQHTSILIHESDSIRTALKKINVSAKQALGRVLLVVDHENKLLGTVTDGDIRRYILSGESLDSDIRELYKRNPVYMKEKDFSISMAKKLLIENQIELLPVLDAAHRVCDFAVWSRISSGATMPKTMAGDINIPVVIMAGGKGTRLYPFTRILPKPLVPVGDKPIIEIIIDEFKKQNVTEYYITLNHKGEMIKAYFNGLEKDYEIKYVRENTFLGTAGCLKLLEGQISDTFIVSNCDVIVKADFEEVLRLQRQQDALLTVISSIQHYKIPYGVINFKKGGKVIDIVEKPEYTFTINTGVYVLNKEVLQFIPEDTHFDMTDLIKILRENNKTIITYPVNENDYLDIGQWKEYKESIKIFEAAI